MHDECMNSCKEFVNFHRQTEKVEGVQKGLSCDAYAAFKSNHEDDECSYYQDGIIDTYKQIRVYNKIEKRGITMQE